VCADGLHDHGQSMPGILTMASRGAEGALVSGEGESKKRSFDGKMVNGDRNSPRIDVPAGNPSVNGTVIASNTNGASTSLSAAALPMAQQMAQLPPELEHLSSEFYHPLGKLLVRVGQECFNELNEVLQKMADLSISLQANSGLTNGHSMVNGGQDNTELSKQKKLLLMQFAQVNRAKFIKLQVLAEWGKRASADIAKCIDLFSWEREQSGALDSVDDTLHWLKMWSAHARQSNPDIRTALAILATKKADWIPDVSCHSIS
jgi:mediator of RNA polymerase II transcription subunit 14